MMSESSQEEAPSRSRKSSAVIIIVVLSLLAAAGGFALSYSGVIAPDRLMGGVKASKAPPPAYLDMPQIVLSLAGPRPRTLVMSVTVEARPDQVKTIKEASPRIIDSFNIFLSEVDPLAYERRGVLDIVKSEMTTRLSNIIGTDGFNSLLIMEFRIQ